MGVLKELMDNNEAHFADSGGFVSPSGLAYIGRNFSCPQTVLQSPDIHVLSIVVLKEILLRRARWQAAPQDSLLKAV
jgi:hypothetical protein